MTDTTYTYKHELLNQFSSSSWAGLLLGLLMIASGTPAAASSMTEQTYTFAQLYDGSGWYPYQIPQNMGKPGILIELTPRIFERAGLKLDVRTLPAKRSITAYDQGEIDFIWASPVWFPDRTFPETDLSTISVFPVQEVLVAHAQTTQDWTHIAMLHGLEVGTIHGYRYATEDKFIRYDTRGEQALMKMLDAQRLDVVIMNKLSARYLSGKMSVPIKIGAVYSDGPLMLRTHKDGPAAGAIPQLSAAIDSLKADGSIDRIIQSYVQ